MSAVRKAESLWPTQRGTAAPASRRVTRTAAVGTTAAAATAAAVQTLPLSVPAGGASALPRGHAPVAFSTEPADDVATTREAWVGARRGVDAALCPELGGMDERSVA